MLIALWVACNLALIGMVLVRGLVAFENPIMQLGRALGVAIAERDCT